MKEAGLGLLELFSYGFIQRAIVAGSCVAVICSVLGVLLVLRRLSLIGDGLAHVTFGGVAMSLVINQHPLTVSIPMVAVSSLGILKLTERARIYGDAAIGIVSSLGIAAGIMLASMGGGFNIDLFSYLFGNILAISSHEVVSVVVLSLVVIAVISIFFNEIFSITFDEDFAKVSGIRTKTINSILVVLTGIAVVLTMKVVGIMLTSSLMILPAVTAFQVAKGFRNSIIIASAVGVLSVTSGIMLSFVFNLPTGASVVILNFFFFIAAFGFRNFLRSS
jgi:zinc transport system permease protein